jgi:hypothetical protein
MASRLHSAQLSQSYPKTLENVDGKTKLREKEKNKL